MFKNILRFGLLCIHKFLIKVEQDAFKAAARRKMSITSSAATMRVLSVLRHWVTKHSQVRKITI